MNGSRMRGVHENKRADLMRTGTARFVSPEIGNVSPYRIFGAEPP